MPRYQYIPLGGGEPLPILVVWRDPVARFAGLIDSGADATCLSLPIAVSLGVKFDPGAVENGRGAGGTHPLWRAQEDVTLQSAVGPIVLTRPAINAALPFILLGRTDLFAQYRIAFNQRELWFEIEPYLTGRDISSLCQPQRPRPRVR